MKENVSKKLMLTGLIAVGSVLAFARPMGAQSQPPQFLIGKRAHTISQWLKRTTYNETIIGAQCTMSKVLLTARGPQPPVANETMWVKGPIAPAGKQTPWVEVGYSDGNLGSWQWRVPPLFNQGRCFYIARGWQGFYQDYRLYDDNDAIGTTRQYAVQRASISPTPRDKATLKQWNVYITDNFGRWRSFGPYTSEMSQIAETDHGLEASVLDRQIFNNSNINSNYFPCRISNISHCIRNAVWTKVNGVNYIVGNTDNPGFFRNLRDKDLMKLDAYKKMDYNTGNTLW